MYTQVPSLGVIHEHVVWKHMLFLCGYACFTCKTKRERPVCVLLLVSLCSLDCAPPPEPLEGDDALVELDDAQPPEPLECDDALVELEARVPAIATILPFS